MRLISVGAALLSASCNCGDAGGAELKEAAKKGVELFVTTGPTDAVVGVWGGTVFSTEPDSYCTSINATVSVDGLTLARAEPGGWEDIPTRPGQLLPCPFASCVGMCRPESWIFRGTDIGDPPFTTVRVVDGSQFWEMTVQNLFATRSIMQSATSPTTFFWSPATDVPTGLTVDVLFDGGISTVDVAYDAGTLVLLSPLAPGQYQFASVPLVPNIASCMGPTFCSADHGTPMQNMTFTIPP